MSIFKYADKDSGADPAKGIPADEKENEENQVTLPKVPDYKGGTFMGSGHTQEDEDTSSQ